MLKLSPGKYGNGKTTRYLTNGKPFPGCDLVEIQINRDAIGFSHGLRAGLWSWLTAKDLEVLLKEYRAVQRQREAAKQKRSSGSNRRKSIVPGASE